MKFVYPISTSLCATNWQTCWESPPVGVEYLFMGDSSQIHRQITEGNYDFIYFGIGVLNTKLQLDEESGGYRLKNTVPI